MMANKRRRRRRKGEYKWNVFDKILLVLALFILVFVVAMIVLFALFQSVPDALIVAVFTLCTSECGFMAWIERKDKKMNGDGDND